MTAPRPRRVDQPRARPGESAAGLLGRARERFAVQDYRGAIVICERLLELGPTFADAHHLMGVSWALLGQPARALEAFDRALELNPRYLEALVHRALALSALGRGEEAQAGLELAAHLTPPPVAGMPAAVAAQLANRHAELARDYEDAGQLGHAIAQYERALELGPMFHDLRYRMARLLLEAGRVLEAREALEAILAASPDFIDARATLGLACYMAGDPLAARRVWQDCLSRRPRFARVEAWLGMLDREAR